MLNSDGLKSQDHTSDFFQSFNCVLEASGCVHTYVRMSKNVEEHGGHMP